ncbi:MAG: MGDG synthase family glycosyltransferase [Solirubrobacteraceae bacterium]
MSANGSPSILIFSAAIGEGHDLPARALAQGLADAAPGATVRIEDGLDAMGPLVRKVLIGGSAFDTRLGLRMFELEHRLITDLRPTRWLAGALLYAFGGRGLSRRVAAQAADVVVSTYPGVTEVLARLRRHGRLAAPVVSAITDLASLRYWASPGVDLHLVTHPESIDEVRTIAPASRVECVQGLTSPDFLVPCDRREARRRLAIPDGTRLVVVSGGGWAVGDLQGAAEVALGFPDTVVICLCGRSEAVREQLQRRFAREPRVRVVGFTDQMSELLSAADALIHSTAGLTVLEAHMRGCPVISYGWGRGHVRTNNEAFRRFRLAEVAATRDDLAAALRAALDGPRPSANGSFADLRSAASLVLSLAGPQPAGAAIASAA